MTFQIPYSCFVFYVIKTYLKLGIFSTRQHIAYMIRALYAIARPSVRSSICLSVTWVEHTKTVDENISKTVVDTSKVTIND